MGNESNKNVTINNEGRVVLPNGLELCMSYEDYRYMQLLQDYVTEIMLVIDKFCRENDITYYLGEGTLLGAVRHKGFIPWDDDADILMPREDYEKFLRLAKDGLPDGYALDSVETNPHHWTVLSHVQLTRKVPYVKKRLEGIALNNGPDVDIFPLDYVPEDNTEELKKRGKQVRILRRTLWIKSGLHPRSWYKTLRRRLEYYYPLKIYGWFRSFKSLHRQIDGIMTATNDKERNFLVMFGSLYRVSKETHKAKYFGKPVYTEFEGHMFPIPENSDRVLRRIYGNYMQLPPVKNRKSKHFFNLDESLLSQSEPDEKFAAAVKDIEEFRVKNGLTESMAEIEEEKPFTGLFYFIKDTAWRILRKMKRYYRRCRRDKRCSLLAEYHNMPIEENTVFYDAFSGLGILDSPRTIFKRLLEREEFNSYTHVWTVNDFEMSKANLDEFRNLPNVKFVKRNSPDYLKYLSVSKYLICNSSVPQYFSRRDNQVYLNTWHGVPSKVMGYERAGQRVNATQNIEHNFLNTTHMIAANHFTGERMFKTAYMMDGIYEGKLLDEPLPRTDTLRNTSREYAMKKLNDAGIYTDKKIIVYAPTWKGKLYNSVEYDLTELKDAVKTLRSRINTDEYDVFLRVHYFIYRAIMMDKEMQKLCIPFTIDTDEMLSIVDVLISDYSSIFFDFLGSGKPILFYVPDIEDYSENRGLYIPMEEMPGPVSTTLEGIADSINDLENVKAEYADKYKAMYDWCCSKEDGNVADRVIDAVFLGKESDTLNCRNDKKKLLIMADYTTSFMDQYELTEALTEIDYDKYDVTLLTGNPRKEAQQTELEELDRRVRILVNDKHINSPSKVRRSTNAALKNATAELNEAAVALSLDREWQRLVGDCKFDKLCVVSPSTATLNWLLLSYAAPIKDKALIRGLLPPKSAFNTKKYLEHFDGIYKTVDEYFKTL